MAITLRARSDFKSEDARFTARLTYGDVADLDQRADYIKMIGTPGAAFDGDALQGYAGIIVTKETLPERMGSSNAPVISLPSLDHLSEGHIVAVEPRTGMVMTVFRPESRHNVVFTTDRCNSNCLMCSQPPKDVDDSWRIREHLRVLSLIETPPEFLCITGGEPTLLGDDLIKLITEIRDRLPGTSLQMLTNGRNYANADYAAKVAAVAHPKLISAIPLYADVAGIHDYVVQSEGAFDQTVEGLYNAAAVGLKVEIRIVLHKQSIPRLVELAEFIYANFPFAAHVAFMGMEHMGYVKKNWDSLWIDPVEYMPVLERAIQHLWRRRMTISIYNLQLCLLPQSLWSFARRSISDYKNEYVEVCDACSLRDHCAGMFTSQLGRYSDHLRAI
jgi:His-Xaa-Ser system radical SAM maturase HxsC